MLPSRKRVRVHEEVRQQEERREIKRRKKSLAVDSQTKVKPKKDALSALKQVLNEGTYVESQKTLVNTRPRVRISLNSMCPGTWIL
jgi:hypothetical protein